MIFFYLWDQLGHIKKINNDDNPFFGEGVSHTGGV